MYKAKQPPRSRIVKQILNDLSAFRLWIWPRMQNWSPLWLWKCLYSYWMLTPISGSIQWGIGGKQAESPGWDALQFQVGRNYSLNKFEGHRVKYYFNFLLWARCEKGNIYLFGEQRGLSPRRDFPVQCAASANSYNSSRGHVWRVEETGEELSPCVEGKNIKD